MDGSSHLSVCDGGESRFHLSNQSGKLLITGFGEMDFVPDPAGLALNAKALSWLLESSALIFEKQTSGSGNNNGPLMRTQYAE